MRLIINNLAKVREANINIDGIAVITGPNDSGKSTIGKVLDAVFASLKIMDSRMKESRKRMLLSRVNKTFEESPIAEYYVEHVDQLWRAYWDDEDIMNGLYTELDQEGADYHSIINRYVDTLSTSIFETGIDKADYYLNNKEALIDSLETVVNIVMSISDAVRGTLWEGLTAV